MKNILILLLMASLSLRAGDYGPKQLNDNYIYFLLLTCAAQVQAQDNNCSNPLGPFSDAQTVGITYFQIFSGVFAIVLISSNFFAPGFFWYKHQKKMAKELKEQIDQVKQQSQIIEQDIADADAIRQTIKKKLNKPRGSKK